MEQTPQEQFDALVEQLGPTAVIDAIKGHVHPDGNGCGTSGCPKGYVCANGNCVLDVG